MKNLLNNLLNWVLKKGPSETKKDQAWEEKEQAGSKKEQVKRTKLEMGSEAREVMGSEVMSVKGSEAVSANHALITQLSRNNHPISLRAIRYAAVLFMVLMVGIGNVWGTDVHYVLVSKGYAPLTKKSLDASYNVLKTDGTNIGKVTSISSSITAEGSLYYNSTSPTYANLTNTSKYGDSSGDSNTLKGIKISKGNTATISLGSQTFTKIDVIYRCESSSAGTLTIAGEEVATSSTSIGLKSKTGTFTTSITLSATGQNYRVVVILTREYSPSYTVTYDANGGSGTEPTDANTYEADDPVTVLGKNTLSKSGYIFAGWNTAANGSGTPYSPGETMNTGAGNVTLHAQWDTEVDLKYVWKTGNNFCDDNSTSTTTVNMISDNDYFTLTGTGVSQESGASLNIGKAVGNYFLITAKSGYQISSICFNGKIESTNVNKTTDNSDWSGTIASTGTGSDKRYTFDDINSTYFGVKLNTADKGIYIRNMVITIAVASSCTAPNHVDITPTNADGWRYSLGETISLTATAYSSAGTGSPITSGLMYQWQKYISSTWTDINTGTNPSAATATLQIANCGEEDGGAYRCKVSTGAGCETISGGGDGYFVRVFTLYGGYSGQSFGHHKITWTSTYEGTVTINLNASSSFKFKFTDNDGKWYGNSGTISKDLASTWDWGFGSNTSSDATLTTGSYGGGNYVITVDITHFDDGGSKYVNLRSVVYPKKTTYLQLCSDWKAATAKYAIYYYKGGDNGWTDFMTAYACDGDILSAEVPVWATNAFFVRFDPAKTSTGNFDDEWNRSGDNESTLPTDGKDYYNSLSKGGNGQYYGSWGTYSAPTYTVTTAVSPAGYGTVSAASVASVACGTSISASTNTLTVGATNVTATPADATAEYTYAFDNWSWSPSGASVTSAVTATANFTRTPKSYTLTWTTDGDALTGDYTKGTVAYGTAIVQPNTPTKTGYTFNGWSPAVASTMPAANTTYTATWTVKTTTITIDANSGNHGSTTPGNVTATWGSALPSFTAATGASGWNLTGYFTAPTSGTKVINADGTLVAGTDYADGSSHWKYETATLTLFAQYEEEADACYEFTPATSGSAPSSGDVISGTGGGGTMVAGTGQSYTANGLKFESSGDYRYVTVTLDNNLKAGSIIAVTMWMDGTSSNRGLTLQTSSGTKVVDWKFTADSENHEFSYTVEAGDGLINTNVFRLARINNVYLKTVTVSNCGDAACTTPTTAFANGAYTVGGSALDLSTLISSKQGSGAITYTVKNANGTGATIAGTSFTATSAGTATVTATQAANGDYCEKVMDATITVSAAGGCPTAASGEVVYKFVTKSSGLGTSAICAAASTDYPLTTGSGNPLETLTNGTLTARASTAGTTNLKYNTSSINFNGGSNGWLIIGLDCPIKSGDVIRYVNSNSGSVAIRTAKGTSTNEIVLAGNSTTKVQTVVITSAQATAFNELTTVYMVRKSNTSDISYFEIIRPYVITLDANTNGGKVNGENTEVHYMLSGESLVLPHATKSGGYRFKGWFTTSDGATQASTNYSPTGTTTLYAQFEDCPGSGTVYKWEVASGLTNGSLPVGVSGEAEMDANEGNYLSTLIGGTLTLHNKNNHIKISDNSKFSIDDNAPYIIVNLDCALEAGDKFVATVGSHTAYVTKTSSRASTVELPTGTKQETAVPAELEGASTLYIWRGSGNYNISYFEITRTSTTYTVSYDANGGSGTAPTDGTAYARNAEVTVKGNTGSLTKSNYAALAYWNTANDGTGTDYAISTGTFEITADVTLYAKWTQTVTFDANTANHGSTGGSATAVWNATGLTGITHATPASGYKLLGYYTTASGDGVKVLNSDGSFAATNVTDYITSGKWGRTDEAPTLYARYESSGALIWNLGVNTEATSLTTSSKESSFTQIAVANMGDATLSGSTYTKSAKSSLTGKISSPATKSDYVYVTFKVADGYKFTPSNISVKVQPVGENEHKAVELSLADATNTLASSSATKCDGTEKGKTTTVTLAGDGTYFTGTVTLKIYVYADASASATNYNCYRLGTPITIEGAVEATCVMPSFTGLDYDQTSYTVDETASAISVTGAANEDSYHWKYNTVNDRTSGTNVGTSSASYTPPTSEDVAGTRYYWCELTNTCGTVKTPAVGITVSATKSDATISWTGTSASANYGGGGYTVKATVNETGWDGNAADLTLSAPAGIRIYNIVSGTADSKKYVQASFDVTTAFDRETYSSTIPFTVSADATATYNAISDEHAVDFDACTGGGGSSEEYMPVDAAHIDNTTWKGGWVYSGIGMMRYSHGGSALDDGNVKSLAHNMGAGSVITKYYKSSANHFGFYTEKAINGVRLYVYTSNAKSTVSGVYIGNSAYTSGTPSTGAVTYEATYYNDDDGLLGATNDGCTWVEIMFDSEVAAGKYGQINLSKNVYIAGIAFISSSGSGAKLNTHLQWSGGLANNETVNKKTTDAYFTYSASMITENTNCLGAITYSSSDPSVATVDATGKVAMVAAGTTTIKATLAASGCYKKAEISYTLSVTEEACAIAAGTLTLTSGSESKCSSDYVTLTLTGFESGATLQWKDGDTDINNGGNYTIGTDGTTLTTNQPGTYSVIVTNGCFVRSNRITISNKSTSVHVTRLVKEWYIKNGRLTPDIALWELGDDCSFVSVAASDGWGAGTGLTEAELGEKVFYEQDGIVYMKGTEPNANYGDVQNYTLTLTVNDGCSDVEQTASGKLITIHHQQNTDKHVLAFVVNGTDKGDWTAGVTADQTTNVGLYNAIAANFDVLATNSRSTDDEQKIKEYYSQFDILCITDYPNTDDKGVNKKSYVDALGALVDIRPILTMEAWVSKRPNWKAKGISGTPHSPTTRQYTMDLQCKDHEIFAGTKLTKVGEGDDAMYRVSMVDNTKEEYATKDTYTPGSKDYDAGGKPALQGFEFTQEMSDNDLLPIGLIEDGAGNPLQVGIERQHNMEARLMVLGVNSYAMERLTDDGERVVINALNYLMKKNQEDIADCSTSFVGGADGDEKNWNNKDNWTGNTVPLPTQKVRILADCEVSSTVYAQSVLIVTDGKYNHGSDNAAGKLTIKENGALIVGGKIQAALAPAYNRTRATTPDKLLIETSDEHQAALIFDNEEAETQATVNLYSLGRKPSSYQYQYFAVPMEVVPVNPTFANETHGGTGIYTYVYDEASSGWTRRKYYDDLFAFEGLGITTKSATAMEYEMTGNLASTATKEITLTHDGAGLNLVGNSWMAPIQIGALAEDNTDANITKTVYIYCAGRDAVKGAATSGETETAGQWIAIPFEAAEFATWKAAGKLSVIPAMQAFQIKVSAEATLTLDYDKVVRGSTNDLNAKLRAPGRRMAANEVTMTNIRVADSKTHTDLSLFEGDRFSEAFDNGWEAEYMNGDGRSAKLYAETEAGQMAVVAMYDYEGTVVGFAPGQETEYTFSFMGEDNGYYLNDIKLQNSVRISEGETYTFTYEEGDAANRFYISRTAINAPEVATGMENLDAAVPRVQKIIYNDKLYIIRGGRLYDATGKVVK